MSLRLAGAASHHIPFSTTAHNPRSTTQRLFSSTPSSRADSASRKTHYEVLDVPITATQAEIKKQFYQLSLKHHPDRNPNDPSASQRFANLSTAYSTLSDPQKRTRYDRDHGLHKPQQHPAAASPYARAHPTHRGSYVGSRPASGLSKRRSAFRGPPKSFYEHGGYGAQAQRSSTPGSGGGGTSTSSHHPNHDSAAGRSAYDYVDQGTSHFNPTPHLNTQRAEDMRRKVRMRSASEKAMKQRGWDTESFERDVGESTFVRFLCVGGIMTLAFGIWGRWIYTHR